LALTCLTLRKLFGADRLGGFGVIGTLRHLQKNASICCMVAASAGSERQSGMLNAKSRLGKMDLQELPIFQYFASGIIVANTISCRTYGAINGRPFNSSSFPHRH
jgi:hypothetical protein